MTDSPTLSTAPPVDDPPARNERLEDGGGQESLDGAPAIAAPATGYSVRRSVEQHLIWLVIAIAVLLTSALLSTSGETTIFWPGTQTPLPSLCHMKRVTGLDCPGCGLTRCFISLAHGDAASAWNFNPAGVLLFGMLVAQIPYRLAQIWRVKNGRGEWRHRRLSVVLTVVFVSLLMIQWFWKLFEALSSWNG
jgi:hypothetical protein